METKEYKTFDDLVFEEHQLGGKHAVLFFQNGYGVSVVIGRLFYSDGVNTYEVACMDKQGVCYVNNSSFEGDVCGHCSKERVTELMREIQDFK